MDFVYSVIAYSLDQPLITQIVCKCNLIVKCDYLVCVNV